MRKVFVENHCIISPLGLSSEENFSNLKKGESGVQIHHNSLIDDEPFWASLIDNEKIKSLPINHGEKYTRFEKLLIGSIQGAIKSSNIDLKDSRTIFIVSTTKGNISILEDNEEINDELKDKLKLFYSANLITEYFNNPNIPIVISNACISGVVALIYARRLLESGQYDNAVVCGADTIGKFVFSGFKSFQALSPGRCKPFSADRNGINLGEAGAAMVLSTSSELLVHTKKIQINGGAIANDANHISGPSRTGEELSYSIKRALQDSGLEVDAIDMISAHGTATLYNDDMEAKAITLSGLQNTPVNSLKGYFGHTLGTAGILESIISCMSMMEGIIIPTIGFTDIGVTPNINVCDELINAPIKHCLKTASGFGGCNAALVFSNE